MKTVERFSVRGLLAVVAALVLSTAGCTNKQGETEAPVYLTANLVLQPGFINVGVSAPVQIQTITVTSHFKNPAAADPQGFAAVTLESYSVHFRRTDGGSRVPPDQTFPVGVLVPSGGSSTLANFPVLPASAVQQSPFDQLLPFNGGFDRETGKDEIDIAFDLTFFGHTVSGLRVQSETVPGPLLFRFLGSGIQSGNSIR